MPSQRELVLRSIEEFLAEAAALREALRRTEAQLRAVSRQIVAGATVSDVLVRAPQSEPRRDLSERMDALEQARLRYRRFLVAVAQDEGLSLGEIARRWGFSRQLVSRYAKEAAEAET
ncbi:MAG: hypothetical protein WAL04_09275 [Acidimicrobiales bacterium]